MATQRRVQGAHRNDAKKVSCGPEVARYKKGNQEIVVFKDGCMRSIITNVIAVDVNGHTHAGNRFNKKVEKDMLASGFEDEIFC